MVFTKKKLVEQYFMDRFQNISILWWLQSTKSKKVEMSNKVPVHPKEKFPQSIHFYGGISSNGMTKLIKIEGTINTDKYISKILPYFLKKHKEKILVNLRLRANYLIK